MADPTLQGQYPPRGLYQALAVAAMCVQEQANMRPVIADVVTALSYLAKQKYDPNTHTVQNSRLAPGTPPRTRRGLWYAAQYLVDTTKIGEKIKYII